MPAFAFHRIPEAGEPKLSVIDAPDVEAAKARAIKAIKSEGLRAVRLWDGHRVAEVRRPVPGPSDKPAPPKADRGAQMIAMKAEGKTQRQIADSFGISTDRVRQLIARAQSRTRMQVQEPNRAGLSVRAVNVVHLFIAEPETDPSERDRLLPGRIASLTRAQLRDAPNSGKATMAEIEAWLWDRGLCLSEAG